MSIELGEKLKEGRPVLVLIPLLVLHLTLLSIQIEDPSGMALFRRWSLLAGGPLLSVSAAAWHGVSGAWRSYFWLIGARRENARMAKLLDEHRLREAARSQLEAENERLRRLLGFKQTLPFETIGARVVARSPAPDFLTGVLVLDRGKADGVEPDSPVLVAGSVLGRTTVVTPRNAQVQLVTNPDAALGAMVERTRSPGVLGGSGELRLGLNYISNTEPIEVGDAVVTSGLDGIFPKGLPIGRVVLSRKGNSVFRVVEVEPSADLLRVEEVLVLVNHSPVRL